MENFPSKQEVGSVPYEIYDESTYQADALIWLSPQEDFVTLSQSDQFSQSLPLDPEDNSGPDLMPLDCTAGEQADKNSDVAHDQCSNRELIPNNISECDGRFRPPIASSPLTYKPLAGFNLTQWLFRLAALVGILFIGSLLPEFSQPTRVKASASPDAAAARTTAGHRNSGAVRVLTVMAGRRETIKEISLRFVGRFDGDLFQEICNLNPAMNDPDHLEDGQLIKIPMAKREVGR